jgi:hypothetical protein
MNRHGAQRERIARLAAGSALVVFPALGGAALFTRLPLMAFVPAAVLCALAFVVALAYLNIDDRSSMNGEL